MLASVLLLLTVRLILSGAVRNRTPKIPAHSLQSSNAGMEHVTRAELRTWRVALPWMCVQGGGGGMLLLITPKVADRQDSPAGMPATALLLLLLLLLWLLI
jgi:hypothetical protein